MNIQSLGYLGIRSKSLEDWAAYGSRFLGMQLVDRSGKVAAIWPKVKVPGHAQAVLEAAKAL